MRRVHEGPFTVFAEEAHEDSADLLFMPQATAADWATIFSHAEVRRIGEGLALVQAGEEDRAIYFLTEGTVGVRLPRDEGAFKSIDAPSVLGELAFFDAYPRSATLDAQTDVEVVRLDEAAFDRLLADAPDLANAMLRDLARILALRLRMASKVIAGLRGDVRDQ
jgi:CRP-like cAMP-binding protein